MLSALQFCWLKLQGVLIIFKFQLYLLPSGFSITFGPGKTYQYKYETIVNFNEAVSYGKTVGFQLSTEFEIGEIFRAGETQLLKVQV